MSKNDGKKPELTILPQDQPLDRLTPTPKLEPSESTFTPDTPVIHADDVVPVLIPDSAARLKTKSYEPDVASILESKEEEIDSEDAWGDSAQKASPVGWLVLSGLMVFGLVAWAMVTVFKAQSKSEEIAEEKQDLVIDQVRETKEVKQTLAEMEACVRGYLTSNIVEERLKYVRHPERVKPMMVDYYQRHPMVSKDFRYFERIRSMGLESLSFVYGKVELLDGGSHQLMLEQLEDGTFRVDWESDVCYLPIPWTKYIQESPPEPQVMRVYIKRDNFYAYEFREEEKFDSYLLTTRDEEEHIFGFVEKGSKVAMDISRFLERADEDMNNKREPIMLVLRFPENSHSKKCVWIDRLVAPRWTYVKSPKSGE